MKLYRYIVRGADFPLDMLRSDRCWPASRGDVVRLTRSVQQGAAGDPEYITLKSVQPPSVGRWESFLWSVEQLTP